MKSLATRLSLRSRSWFAPNLTRNLISSQWTRRL